MTATSFFQTTKMEDTRLALFMDAESKWDWVLILRRHEQWNWNSDKWKWLMRACRVPTKNRRG